MRFKWKSGFCRLGFWALKAYSHKGLLQMPFNPHAMAALTAIIWRKPGFFSPVARMSMRFINGC